MQQQPNNPTAVTCRNCAHTTTLTASECVNAKNLYCAHCGSPIAWTIAPALYTPNHISLKKRLLALISILALAALSLHTLITQHVTLPFGGKRYGGLIDFDGWEIWLPIASFVFALLALLTLIIDHYDKRFNEYRYQKALKTFTSLAVACYLSAPLIKKLFG